MDLGALPEIPLHPWRIPMTHPPAEPTRRFRRGRIVAAAAAAVSLAVATVGLVLSSPAGAAPGCRVDYSAPTWGGGGGFTAAIKITNLGDPINGWTLSFAFPRSQRLTPPGWSANWSQAAGSALVTAPPLDWNRNLGTGPSTDIGFNGTVTGTANPAPTSFSLNGT